MKTNIVSFLIAAMLFIWLFVFTFEFWFSLLMSASALILFRKAVKLVEADKEDEHE